MRSKEKSSCAPWQFRGDSGIDVLALDSWERHRGHRAFPGGWIFDCRNAGPRAGSDVSSFFGIPDLFLAREAELYYLQGSFRNPSQRRSSLKITIWGRCHCRSLVKWHAVTPGMPSIPLAEASTWSLMAWVTGRRLRRRQQKQSEFFEESAHLSPCPNPGGCPRSPR